VNPSFTTGLVAEAKSSGLSLQYSVASYDEQIWARAAARFRIVISLGRSVVFAHARPFGFL
jgi:hypothetical protein